MLKYLRGPTSQCCKSCKSSRLATVLWVCGVLLFLVLVGSFIRRKIQKHSKIICSNEDSQAFLDDLVSKCVIEMYTRPNYT